MTVLIVGILIVLGLTIGSFLNVVILRLPDQKGLMGRSQCPSCGHTLSPWELVPVMSFLVLRGKCRQCHHLISWQYPLVEFTTAVLFVASYFRFGLTAQLPISLIVICFLTVIFWIDFRRGVILDSIMIPFGIFALLILPFQDFSWDSAIFGALLGGGFFALQWGISRGRWIGGGDIRLGVVMGLLLGWPETIFAVITAYVLGAVVMSPFLLLKKVHRKTAIPFGTFLTVTSLVTWFYGSEILSAYLRFLGYK